MEDVLDRPRLATVGQAVQHEPEVLALVADVDAGVPPPLRLLLLNLGRTHPDVGARGVQVGPGREGAPKGLGDVERRGRRGQVASNRQGHVRPDGGQGLQLERGDLDATGLDLPARVQAIDLDQHQVLFQRRRRALPNAILNEPEGVTVHLEQLVRHAEIPARREILTRLHSRVAGDPALAILHLGALHLQLALGHGHASFLSSAPVERHRQPDHEVVVRAQCLLPSQLEHRIRPQRRLPEPADRRVDLRAGGAEVGVLGQRPVDQLVDRQL